MQTLLLVVHVLLAIGLITFILLQRGKGAEAGAAFGGGGGASQGLFGSKGSANFLSRTSAILATAFFATSLLLAMLASDRATEESQIQIDESVLEEESSTSSPENFQGAGSPAFPDVE